MNKKRRNIIIVCSIIILILAIVLIFLLIRSKNYNYEAGDGTNEGPTSNFEFIVENFVSRVSVRNEFYAVKNAIVIFNTRCDNLSSIYNTDEDIENFSNSIYDILDSTYIKDNNITVDNVKNLFSDFDTFNMLIDDMYCYQQDDNLYLYIVYGSVGNIEKVERTNFKYIVRVDKDNKTYSIIPSTLYVDEIGLGNVNENSDINVEQFKSITNKTENNKFNESIIPDEKYVYDLFDDYKIRSMYDYNGLYNMLDEYYRNTNFPEQYMFEEYCKNNLSKFVSMSINNYNKNKVDGKNKYIIVDQNEEYYVFTEEYPMKYTVKVGK